MGRQVTEMQVEDQKPNGVAIALNGSPNDNGHVTSKIAAVKLEAEDHEVKECTEVNVFVEKCHETKDALVAKTTNGKNDLHEDESEKHEVQKKKHEVQKKSGGDKELSSTQPSDLVTEKNGSYTHVDTTEAVLAGLNLSPNANNMHSPYSSKNSLVIDGLA